MTNQGQCADPRSSSSTQLPAGGEFLPKGKPGRKPKLPEGKAVQRSVSLSPELALDLEAERIRVNEEHVGNPKLQIKAHEHSKLIVRLLEEALKLRRR